MSQDLLAAFGTAVEPSSEQSSSRAHSAATKTRSFFDDLNSSSATVSIANQDADPWTSFATAAVPGEEEDDDDWGEFENAETSANVVEESKPVPPAPSRYQYGLGDLDFPKVETKAKAPKKSLNLSNFDLLSIDDNVRPSHDTGLGKSTEHKAPKDPNILFDASDDTEIEDDDEFGNFEEPEVNTTVSAPGTGIDLLGLDDLDSMTVQTAAKESSPKTPISQKAATAQPLNIPDEPQDEEPWDEFSSWDQDASVPLQAGKSESIPKKTETDDLPHFLGTTDFSDQVLPPTNVPPPSILLSLFPALFDSIDTPLLRRTAAQPQTLRMHLFEKPETVTFLKGYLAIVVVCARIIAGRKLRWKRDTLLSQAMRIGQAPSGKISGMKVTSVDKSEVIKEERELAEVLRVWGQHAGKVKAAVADARKASNELFALIPELRETMPIKTAKETEGGVPSAKPCALCGLKRNERVVKADFDVEDSFGEWWVERTNMHRGWCFYFNRSKCQELMETIACRNFWEEHKKTLQQR
jgi:hypothetical protein